LVLEATSKFMAMNSMRATTSGRNMVTMASAMLMPITTSALRHMPRMNR
jgi:hypothetical protein